jgi:hypothetical protein
VTVEYTTGNGTALAPVDYTALSLATLTFNPGEIVKTVTVAIANDNVVELAETFFVNLAMRPMGSSRTLRVRVRF